jgi:hypothetical protein
MLTRQQFLNATEREQQIFISKLLHVVRSDDDAFREADYMVRSAEITGMFNNVKFGAEIYKNEAEKDLHVQELSAQGL